MNHQINIKSYKQIFKLILGNFIQAGHLEASSIAVIANPRQLVSKLLSRILSEVNIPETNTLFPEALAFLKSLICLWVTHLFSKRNPRPRLLKDKEKRQCLYFNPGSGLNHLYIKFLFYWMLGLRGATYNSLGNLGKRGTLNYLISNERLFSDPWPFFFES